MQYWSIDGTDIVAASEQPLGVSTYLLTDKDYSDFRLTCSVKLCLCVILSYFEHHIRL